MVTAVRTMTTAANTASAPPSPWTPLSFWLFQVSFWLLSVLSLSFMITTFTPVDFANEIIAGRVVTGFLITLGLHVLYQQPRMQAQTGVRKWCWIALINAVAIGLSSLLWVGLVRHAGLRELQTNDLFYNLSVSRFFALLSWHSMYIGIEVWQRTLALKQAALEASLEVRQGELRQLQAQLNPHFLFNALNTIKSGADDPALTREVTQNLADYLRFSLQDSRPLEPLSRELDSLGLYFSIQRARFGDGLDCRMNVSPDALSVHVPPMLLQPLLENAFKFGGETSGRPLRIEVSAEVTAGRLTACVANSGRWVPRPEGAPPGIGLANLRRRLDLLFPGEASLETRTTGDQVEGVITVPAGRGSA